MRYEVVASRNTTLDVGIPGKSLQGNDMDNICTSFIGGIAPEPTLPCSLCGTSMTLIAQVYAPVPGLDRCIRVFGCISGNGCGSKTEGWKVIRIQKNVELSLNDEDESIVVSSKSSSSSTGIDEEEVSKERRTTTTVLQQQMRTLEGNDIWSGKCNSTWDDDQSGNCSDVDGQLENLLLAQEQDTKSKYQHGLKVTPSKTNTCKTAISTSTATEVWHKGTEQPPHSPLCFQVDFIDEPEQSEEEVTDSAIDEMISSYKEMEDDPNILAFLAEHEKAGQNKQEENGKNELFRRVSSKSDEKYEKTPASIQASVIFQTILRRCPAQVLRYDYGSKPLWCSSYKPDSFSTVSPCTCGKDRVFEFQIVSTILHILQLKGMEWGVVSVWCCPDSCEYSLEEALIVQPE